MGRSIARIVAILILIATGALGVYNGFNEWKNPYSPFQRAVYFGVVLYGVLGLVGAYGVIRRRGWSRPVVIGWASMVTFVSATAAIAYSNARVTPLAAIAAGASAALLGAFVVWAARVG